MEHVSKMIKQKKGSAWIWIVIILVVLVVGIGIYFWLSGGDTSVVNNAGSSIPQPPSLPSG